jgi:hypothetical protein
MRRCAVLEHIVYHSDNRVLDGDSQNFQPWIIRGSSMYGCSCINESAVNRWFSCRLNEWNLGWRDRGVPLILAQA